MNQNTFDTMMGILRDSQGTMRKITTFLDDADIDQKETIVSMIYLAASQARTLNMPQDALQHMMVSICELVEVINKLEASEEEAEKPRQSASEGMN